MNRSRYYTGLGKMRPPRWRYMHGACLSFALALHEEVGWPLVRIQDSTGGFIHVACSVSGKLADVRGLSSRYGMRAYFGGDRLKFCAMRPRAIADARKRQRRAFGKAEIVRAKRYAHRLLSGGAFDVR